MFPFYRAGSEIDSSKKEKLLSEQICPLGCLCCIMQQFYNRKCWCKEVKESIGVQTDFPRDECYMAEDERKQKTKNTVSASTQTEESLTQLCLEKDHMTDHDMTDYNHSRRQTWLPARKYPQQTNSKQPECFTQRSQTQTIKSSSNSRHSAGRLSSEFEEHSPLPYTRSAPESIAINNSPPLKHPKPLPTLPTPLAMPSSRGHQTSKVFQSSYNQMVSTSRSNSPPESPLQWVSTVYKDVCNEKVDTEQFLDSHTQNYFTNATTEYTLMQNAIGNIVDKYELTGAKDPKFETALEEIFEEFPDITDTPITRKTVRDKLRHKISSRRHYDRIKNEAVAIGVGVSVLKRRKMHENAIQNKLIGETMLQNRMCLEPSYLQNSRVAANSLVNTPFSAGATITATTEVAAETIQLTSTHAYAVLPNHEGQLNSSSPHINTEESVVQISPITKLYAMQRPLRHRSVTMVTESKLNHLMQMTSNGSEVNHFTPRTTNIDSSNCYDFTHGINDDFVN